MNAATAHRGPDGVGIYEDERVTLGHNWLAVIDLSLKGAQPMKSADGSLVITYNGELYNYRELRRELTDYPFVSETDTEVILAAYTKWGLNASSALTASSHSPVGLEERGVGARARPYGRQASLLLRP